MLCFVSNSCDSLDRLSGELDVPCQAHHIYTHPPHFQILNRAHYSHYLEENCYISWSFLGGTGAIVGG